MQKALLREGFLHSSVVGVRRMNHQLRGYIKSEFTISVIEWISLDLANVHQAAAMSIESLVRPHLRDFDSSNNNKERQT